MKTNYTWIGVIYPVVQINDSFSISLEDGKQQYGYIGEDCYICSLDAYWDGYYEK